MAAALSPRRNRPFDRSPDHPSEKQNWPSISSPLSPRANESAPGGCKRPVLAILNKADPGIFTKSEIHSSVPVSVHKKQFPSSQQNCTARKYMTRRRLLQKIESSIFRSWARLSARRNKLYARKIYKLCGLESKGCWADG